MTTTDKDHARQSAIGTYEAIAELLTKLEQADCAHKDFASIGGAQAECSDCGALVDDDGNAIDELDSDRIREELTEMPLSVQVRGDWYTPGEAPGAPTTFELLMGTGGPAVRICGDLDDCGQPTRAYLQGQDWGTPWFDVFPGQGSGDVLLEFAGTFYYGEGE
jgi:hypothetical protein